ncbi:MULTISPECIES: FAD-dependent oxidoreductase [Brucella/Ochrobactrum group]|uniref:FAD-dependent oxidoreductase n=2 Tax=Brucella/Ochrobactrum group TaxID=2826938 RepID=A0A502BLE8_9HYPH|nr:MULTISPECIES: FAD-dependent oxidoreductase [Brucella/Ochrobactrum group]MCX2699032.1 FAD-dependent oxidoreductase [Ochrobactrum chromiisoli]TPF74499.1 FAD-dependent oxidoreductase [Brucella gallinifaecis]
MRDIYDTVVVGGGIIAAAAGQHLAAAGYRTLLAEQGDYGAGTSSKTSRLQHCGLGYLSAASGSIAAFLAHPRSALDCLGLMRRAMRGRAEFVRLAPERVKPITFIVPLTPENAIPRWKAQLAFRLMAASDGGQVPLNLRILSAKDAQMHPALQGMAGLEDIRGAMCFTEYQYHWPERIVVDTINKARAIGMEALNHTAVTALARQGDLWRVTLAAADGSRDILVRAVVNCAGVWIDKVTALAGVPHIRKNIGEKGTNIVVQLPERLRGLGFETVTEAGAPFYLIPWGELHYVGPWDSVSDYRPEGFRATEAEISAVLDQLGRLFPSFGLKREDVVYAWAGVRPRSLSGNGRSATPSVREHDLTDDGLPNVFTFTGGLLMTHRDAGRRLTRAVRRRLKPSGSSHPLDPPLPPSPDMNRVTEASIAYAILNEQARSLSDILRRRLSVGWEPDLGRRHAERAAKLAAPHLGWTKEDEAVQVAAFFEETVREFALRTS